MGVSAAFRGFLVILIKPILDYVLQNERPSRVLLGEIPLDKNLRIHSDEGQPVCIAEPNSPIAKIYLSIAQNINKNIK